MMKLCHLCLCASVLISLSAFAAPSKAKAEVTEKKVSIDTGKKDKHGKEIRREFPVMFSIADRAKKHREKKAVKK